MAHRKTMAPHRHEFVGRRQDLILGPGHLKAGLTAGKAQLQAHQPLGTLAGLQITAGLQVLNACSAQALQLTEQLLHQRQLQGATHQVLQQHGLGGHPDAIGREHPGKRV